MDRAIGDRDASRRSASISSPPSPVAAGVMVIAARNPVHSVLFLILAFFNAAGLFVLLGAEFLAMILVIVYVGAVAVLFLFVVMMLDINFAELRQRLPALPADRRADRPRPAGRAGAGVRRLGGRARGRPAIAAAPMPPGAGLPTPRRSGALLYTRYVYRLPGGGHDPAGGHDRRHRADAAARARACASRSIAQQIARSRAEDASRSSRCRPGQGVS